VGDFSEERQLLDHILEPFVGVRALIGSDNWQEAFQHRPHCCCYFYCLV
jgi:hypothetical protein